MRPTTEGYDSSLERGAMNQVNIFCWLLVRHIDESLTTGACSKNVQTMLDTAWEVSAASWGRGKGLIGGSGLDFQFLERHITVHVAVTGQRTKQCWSGGRQAPGESLMFWAKRRPVKGTRPVSLFWIISSGLWKPGGVCWTLGIWFRNDWAGGTVWIGVGIVW